LVTISDVPLERSVTAVAREFQQNFRVLVLNGPRQAGKSTLMAQLIAETGGELRSLDDDAARAAARRDPTGFIASAARPLYIDEVQRGGDSLILAIKSAVDKSNQRGQFVLAGSTRFLTDPSLSESLAGRAGILDVLPFSESELVGTAGNFLDRVFGAEIFGEESVSGIDQIRLMPTLGLTRADYLAMMVRGGFPAVTKIASPRARTAWFASYVGGVTDRDVREMARVNEPSAAAIVLRGLAALDAELLVTSTLADRAGLSRATVDRYVELLDAVFLAQRLGPWSRNPLTKAVRRPKVHLIDSGLLCSLLGVNANALNNPTSKAIGPVAETFVVNELSKQASWSENRIRLHHYRDSHGNDEIDIVAETGDGRVVGFEVKAAQAVHARDFRHLAKIGARLGDDFVHGFVVYLGQRVLSFGDGLTALPLGALWAD
jgi:predicted AAA+ superfamily ATPase